MLPQLDKRVRDALARWRERDNARWNTGFLGLITHYIPWFEAERIEYMFDDTVAVRLQGGDPNGQNASLVVTPASWERMQQTAGTTFSVRPDGQQGMLSVHGMGHASPVHFRDSLDGVRVCVYGVWVASLKYLIDESLFRPTELDRERVIGLIRANALDNDFTKVLSTRNRRVHYLNCLAEAGRRGKEE